nr:MAG TPA: hypothetical protein [Bacteriophage sp.]
MKRFDNETIVTLAGLALLAVIYVTAMITLIMVS